MPPVPPKGPEPVTWPLPLGPTMDIIERSGSGSTVFILLTAQKVCSMWRKACKESDLFKVMRFKRKWKHFKNYSLEEFDHNREVEEAKDRKFEALVKRGVDRSDGKLIEFHISHYGSYLLMYMATRSKNLLRLTLDDYSIGVDALAGILGLLPKLEELHLILSHLPETGTQMIKIGRACPALRSFTLQEDWDLQGEFPPFTDHRVIGEAMPGLHQLRLISNRISNDGLHEIMKHCTELKSLDLRDCRKLDLDEELLRLCNELDAFRHPADSTDDLVAAGWSIKSNASWERDDAEEEEDLMNDDE